MLVKRVTRESKIAAKSFNRLCKNEITQMNNAFSTSVYIIGNGFKRAVDAEDDICVECGKLLMNACNTIQASFEILRAGYILQPGMLLRSVIETFSVISYVITVSTGYQQLIDGEIDGNKTIKYGKKVIPTLGKLHGLLSNNFVHTSKLHSDFNIILEYKEMTEPLRINLDMIKAAIWHIEVISELVYFHYFEGHEYWKRLGENQYAFDLTPRTRKKINEFFGV